MLKARRPSQDERKKIYEDITERSMLVLSNGTTVTLKKTRNIDFDDIRKGIRLFEVVSPAIAIVHENEEVVQVKVISAWSDGDAFLRLYSKERRYFSPPIFSYYYTMFVLEKQLEFEF